MTKILQTVKVGRFTLVEIETETGVKAVGISRRTQGDSPKPEVGEKIATNRAVEASKLKERGKKLNNPLMG